MYQDTLTLPADIDFHVPIIGLSLFIIAVIVVGACMLVYFFITHSIGDVNGKKKALLTGCIAILLAAASAIGIFNLTQAQNIGAVERYEGISQNVQDVKDNIKNKYDVDDVQEWDDASDSLSGILQSTPEINVPIIVSRDDERFLYNLIQDPQTFEPVLQNMPVNGTDTIGKMSPNSEELLKESK